MTNAAPAAAPGVAPSPVAQVPVKQDTKVQPTPEVKVDTPSFKGTKHKVKDSGGEREVDYDELVRGYQNAKESTRRYQEASQEAKQAREIREALKAGDVKFIANELGPEKARKVFEDYLIEQMAYEALPPAEKALREERRQREELEAKLADRDKATEKEAYDRQAQQAFEDLDREIGDALKAAGRASSPKLALRILDHIEAAIKGGEEPVPAAKAYQYAMKELKAESAALYSEMTPEEAHSLLPKEFIEKLMKHQVNQVLDGKAQQPRNKAPAKPQEVKPLGTVDWFKEKEKQFKRK